MGLQILAFESAIPDVELVNMANDESDTHAPLISSEQGSELVNDHFEDEAKIAPNAFIWMLTFTAGISGVLFGYDVGSLDALDARVDSASVLLKFFMTLSTTTKCCLAERHGRKMKLLT